MSYNTDLQENNADLQAILEQVNNLPESDSSGSIDLGITGATVGQTVKITEVDENGVPTAWEPVDFPSGGGMEEVARITLTENVSSVELELSKPCNRLAIFIWANNNGKSLFYDTSTENNVGETMFVCVNDNGSNWIGYSAPNHQNACVVGTLEMSTDGDVACRGTGSYFGSGYSQNTRDCPFRCPGDSNINKVAFSCSKSTCEINSGVKFVIMGG